MHAFMAKMTGKIVLLTHYKNTLCKAMENEISVNR